MSESDVNVPELAASLIAQSPPGQVQDVVNDLRIIVGAASAQGAVDSAVEAELLPHIRRRLAVYHRENFQPVQIDGTQSSVVLLSDASWQKNEQAGDDVPRYVDPTSKRSFALDHVRLTPTDLQPHEIPADHEVYRAALNKSLKLYLSNHYATSKSFGSVFCSSKPKKATAKPVEVEAEEVSKEDVAEPAVEEQEDAVQVGGAGESEQQAGEEESVKADDEQAQDMEAKPEAKEESEVVAAETKEADAEIEAKEDGAEAVEGKTEATEGGKVIAPDSGAPVDNKEAAETPSNDKIESEAKDEETILQEQESVAVASPESPPENPVYTIQIVGDKVNTSNFWSGRWRSSYVIDPTASDVIATIRVDVHYFEAGNVQLAAKHSGSISLPPAGDDQASKIVTAISKFESEYQLQLNETYSALGDKAFKALRRALPVYRTKIDWEKIGSYKAGWDWIAEGKKANGAA